MVGEPPRRSRSPRRRSRARRALPGSVSPAGPSTPCATAARRAARTAGRRRRAARGRGRSRPSRCLQRVEHHRRGEQLLEQGGAGSLGRAAGQRPRRLIRCRSGPRPASAAREAAEARTRARPLRSPRRGARAARRSRRPTGSGCGTGPRGGHGQGEPLRPALEHERRGEQDRHRDDARRTPQAAAGRAAARTAACSRCARRAGPGEHEHPEHGPRPALRVAREDRRTGEQGGDDRAAASRITACPPGSATSGASAGWRRGWSRASRSTGQPRRMTSPRPTLTAAITGRSSRRTRTRGRRVPAPRPRVCSTRSKPLIKPSAPFHRPMRSPGKASSRARSGASGARRVPNASTLAGGEGSVRRSPRSLTVRRRESVPRESRRPPRCT